MPKFCKFVFFLSFLSWLAILIPSRAFAIYDPVSVPNNSFGIHIVNISDLDDAARLVNSGGGDWGYVTIVINEKERSYALWQEVFNKMRKLHIIPIVRVATKENSGNWEKPKIEDIDNWVNFFNSLNWVIKNRYVVIGNEVNLGKEWGGEVSPEEYATYLKVFTEKLKNSNPDYFVIQGGFDASLPTTKTSLDEKIFLKRVVLKEPLVFELVDGWSSHSYPNPNFSGSEYAKGRGTIRTFEWEISLLKSLGVKKNLPIFITETGWAHKVNGNTKTSKFFDESKLYPKFEYAFSEVWNKSNIVAVTPFVLNYEYPPFDMFSWKNSGSFNSLYTNMQNFKKNKGSPIQEDAGEILRIFTPGINLLGTSYTGLMVVENKGQKIWSKEEISIEDENEGSFEILKFSFDLLEPGSSGFIVFKGKSPVSEGTSKHAVYLKNNGQKITGSASFKITSIATIYERLLTSLGHLWHPVK